MKDFTEEWNNEIEHEPSDINATENDQRTYWNHFVSHVSRKKHTILVPDRFHSFVRFDDTYKGFISTGVGIHHDFDHFLKTSCYI